MTSSVSEIFKVIKKMPHPQSKELTELRPGVFTEVCGDKRYINFNGEMMCRLPANMCLACGGVVKDGLCDCDDDDDEDDDYDEDDAVEEPQGPQ